VSIGFHGPDVLDNLRNARWDTVAKTYGSSHATLIGLLVEWWISSNPDNHWALEGGLSFGRRPRGVGGGICDALLCEGREAVAVVEVEGTRGVSTAQKIGKFFNAEYEELETLRFAILLLYAYSPKGRGPNRYMPPATDTETIEEVKKVSASYPDKLIIVVAVDKIYEGPQAGVRQHNKYYMSRLSQVNGSLYEGGEESMSLVLYKNRMSGAQGRSD
jgi:hypothetical protein